MRFIEKKPQGENPLVLTLSGDNQTSPNHEENQYVFSLLTENHENVATGRCSVKKDDDKSVYLYIDAIFVEGNTNNPTKANPKKFVGIGQILVFCAIKYGLELKIDTVSLLPVDNSEGFYLKMGFHPEISGRVNRMPPAKRPLRSQNGKLSTEWISRFAQASFENPAFRSPDWCGNILNIYLNLRQYIMNNWDIID